MSVKNEALMLVFVFIFIPLVLSEIARSKFKYTLEDFFIQSRKMGMWVAFFTIGSAWFSSYSMFGATRGFIQQGPLYMTSFAWSVLFGLIFFVVGRRLWFHGRRHNYLTAADFFDDIYRNRTLSVSVAAILIFFTVPYLLIQIRGGAYIITTYTKGDVPLAVGELVVFLIVIIFLWSGGLRSIAMADILFGLMIIASIVLLVVSIIGREGSVEDCFAMKDGGEDFFKLGAIGEENSPLAWFALFIVIPVGAYMGPPMWVRTYAIGDAKVFRYVPLIITLSAVLYLGPIIAGTAMRNSYPSDLITDDVLIEIVIDNMDTLSGVFILCGIAAALLSTSNAHIHSLSSIITVDIYKKHINRQATDRELINTGKWAVLGISVAAYLMLLFTGAGMFDLLIFSLSGTMQIFVPAAGALFWSRSNPKAAVAGIWTGTLLMMVMFFCHINAAICGIAGFLLNTVIFAAASLILPTDVMAYEKIVSYDEEYSREYH